VADAVERRVPRIGALQEREDRGVVTGPREREQRTRPGATTFGSSNGSTPITAPATAVMSSQRMNSAPSCSIERRCQRITG